MKKITDKNGEETFEYEGFVYKKKNDLPSIKSKIITIQPQTVYKYYPISDYTIDSILNGYLYLSHPFDFNDYYDSNPELINIRHLDKDKSKFICEKIYGNFYSEKNFDYSFDINYFIEYP